MIPDDNKAVTRKVTLKKRVFEKNDNLWDISYKYFSEEILILNFIYLFNKNNFVIVK